MNCAEDKFNYLVIVFAASIIISVFTKFSVSPGIESALFLILGALLFFAVNSYAVKIRNYVLPLLFLVLCAAVSYFHADFQYNARNGILLISYCASAYMLSFFLKPYDKRSVLLIPVFIALWLTIFLFATKVTVAGLLEPQALSATMSATSGFLVMALCLSLAFWQPERKIYMYTSYIVLVAIFLTKSHYAFAVGSAAFSIFLFSMGKKLGERTRLMALVLAALSAAALSLAAKTGYFASKLPSWQTAAAVIKDNLLFGSGFGNYQTLAVSYSQVPGPFAYKPENLFLQAAAETGIPGFLLFLCLLCVFFVLTAKKLRSGENKALYLPVLLAASSFIIYNLFESSAFISTNMLVFFIILAFPADAFAINVRKRKINTYLAILAVIPVLYVLALPLIAAGDYKKGIMFFSSGKLNVSEDYFLDALEKDSLNPEYSSKLSDIYFAMWQKEEKPYYLQKAVEYKKFASSLNRHSGKYLYDLAWLYHAQGNKELASEYIVKALEMDKFNEHFRDSYGTLIL